ncbi:hypothetical protein ACFLYO_05305 [Chloroflexota bacterium]
MSDQEQINDQEQPDLEELLSQGVAAARAGDKEQARSLFEAVVAQDNANEKGWYFLAMVAADNDDRIEYLQKVLTINPDNARALAALEKAGGEPPAAAPSRFSSEALALNKEVVPGVTRQMVALATAGLVAMLLVTCCMLVMMFNNNGRKAQQVAATEGALQSTRDTRETEVAMVATETALALELTAGVPTITPYMTLPPTWTPIPSPTPDMALVPATPLATAIGNTLFSGSILAASGEDRLGGGFVPLVQIPLDGSPSFQFFDERATSPNLSPRGDLMVYTRYSSATRGQTLEIRWMDNSQEPQLLSTLLGGKNLRDQDFGNFSPDGALLAFSASEPASPNRDIFVIDLAALFNANAAYNNGDIAASDIAERALTKLTNSTVDSYAPDWGDSTRLVIVQDSSMIGGGVDIKVLNVNGEVTDVTANGNAYIENHPQLAPEGLRVAFDAYPVDNPDDVDIYIIALSGGEALLQVDNDTIDMRPIWSDDGQFLVYASDRARNDFELYLLEVGTYANYQVTVNDVYDMPGDWIAAAGE